ncbi:MAG: hypothetical protein ACRD04_14630 [Terriglobales bacterium]
MSRQILNPQIIKLAHGTVTHRAPRDARCTECGQPIESTRFSFGGGFSCERCVRQHFAHLSAEKLEQELRARAWVAVQGSYAAAAPEAPAALSHVLCLVCLAPTEGTSFAFSGGLACESCVRRYYASRTEEEVQSELRCRASAARAMGASVTHVKPGRTAGLRAGGGLVCEPCSRNCKDRRVI